MKAFQVRAPHEFSLAQVETPVAAPGEVVVGVAYAGICGSDMHIIHGQNAFVRFPRVTGHEFAGVVQEVGEGVETLSVGDRVCVDPVISCGTCYPCRIGRSNVCTHLQVIGVHRDGGFSERVSVPAENAHKLPEGMPLSHAALVEPYSIALNVLDRMQPQPGDSVLVYGAGVIGLTIVQMARALGLTDITVTDVIDTRLQTARALGATCTINGQAQDVESVMKEQTGGEGVPLIVDAACIPALMPQIVRLASPAGRIGLLGFNAAPSDLVQLEMIKKELTLVGSRLNNRKFPRVIELMATGKLNAQDLISHRVAFDDMPEAIDLIESHPEQTRKVLVELMHVAG
ncbi:MULTISPECIES: Zn-dependent oxidoreductase [Pseudomonas]|uniref:Oxidoreductase n=1 Tax=Pseudomonas luteola TaxID=47886 RepID=A0A2X2CGI7_PSELU|nr:MULTISPECIES: Zn-dependent oxidoreductase [Pseudomonas]ENA29868.1 chlorophyll synthesis pathway protein BchC [Pseudomonas sp. HPB0071]MBF8640838.1 Zn-dependent oxidoreductase [Pseudomonas zeshuii]RRW45872.1 Zn-dependent oxidoreductase [Pseudomonas luteola]SHI78323.1 L-gulonate 5-dehydrogenase [Pseudomonas zeshuii]SPZ06233.1 oxidoreductase [Pseudomonas luteola]